jgi:hypothetical protein
MAQKPTFIFVHVELEPTTIHYDNQSYINLSENPVFHDRLKT